MVSSSQGIVSFRPRRVFGHNGLLDRYFYFSMSLVVAAIVVWGFSHSINDALLHPAIPRPFLLWVHSIVFTSWVVFYIFQSVLVRTHNVKLHRFIGWFGVVLAAIMVPLGFAIAIVMGRFDKHMLNIGDSDTFLSVPFGDIIMFGASVTFAIAWRKKPELHRRLLLIATCVLLDAAFDRIDYIFDHNLGFLCVNALILLGVARDFLVDRRIHRAYLAALPLMMSFEICLIYLWRGAPAWWLHTGQSILQ